MTAVAQIKLKGFVSGIASSAKISPQGEPVSIDFHIQTPGFVVGRELAEGRKIVQLEKDVVEHSTISGYLGVDGCVLNQQYQCPFEFLPEQDYWIGARLLGQSILRPVAKGNGKDSWTINISEQEITYADNLIGSYLEIIGPIKILFIVRNFPAVKELSSDRQAQLYDAAIREEKLGRKYYNFKGFSGEEFEVIVIRRSHENFIKELFSARAVARGELLGENSQVGSDGVKLILKDVRFLKGRKMESDRDRELLNQLIQAKLL